MKRFPFFLFLSADHPEISEIIERLISEFKGKNVAISFPSLRIDSFSFSLASRISDIRRTGLTFAPETGQSLRQLIGKPVGDDKLEELAVQAKKSFWRQLKLYFISGLPGETRQTLEEIGNLIERLSKTIAIKASFTTFIPRPHTPFQWERFPEKEEIMEKHKYLISRFSKNRFVKLNFHSYDMSFVETILSRSGRDMSRVIEDVWRSGGKMENWNEHFKHERWIEALEKEGIATDVLTSGIPYETPLPWQHIVSGVHTDKLRNIREKFHSSCR